VSSLNFDIINSPEEGSRAFLSDKTLEGVYHKGQNLIWDGRKVLNELLEKHSKPSLTEEKRKSLIGVLTLILWGELAAWKTSGALASDIDDFGAKMAATSQAHDEARHFFVMKDYLRDVLDHSPVGSEYLSEQAQLGLEDVINTTSLSKKLLGMQLMVEPVAITIFKILRESNVEPILCELLRYYERDEARHIALGVKHLPRVIERMSWREILSLIAWQGKMLKKEIDGLSDLKPFLDELEIDAEDLLRAAEDRQVRAAEEMIEQLGWYIPIVPAMRRIIHAYVEMTWQGSPVKAARTIVLGPKD
jgi:hypothetical protein